MSFLILTLHPEYLEYFRERFCRRALGTWNRLVQEKKRKKKKLLPTKCLTSRYVFEGLWLVGTHIRHQSQS